MKTSTTRPKHAAIYARVSTEDQAKGYSIPTQIEGCQQAARQDGYTVPPHYIFVDEGISGTTLDRPDLRQVRALVTTQAITALYVYDPDRLSRNLGHQLLLAEELEHHQVTLRLVSHPIEHGPEGWLFFQLRGALAEYERTKILERARRGLHGRARAGSPGGGQVAFGYQAIREPHKARWEIIAEEAALVQRIYSLCLQGLSTRAIAWRLSEERVPTLFDRRPKQAGYKKREFGAWAPATVYRILTYHGYTGTAGYAKRSAQAIPLVIPPIIDPATLQAAREQLHRNKTHAKRNRRYELPVDW